MKHILLPLVIIGVVNSLYSTVPLLLWSSNQIASQNTVTATISAQHFENAVSSLLKNSALANDNPLSQFLSSSTQPEVLVLFVTPEVHTDAFVRHASAYDSAATGGAFSALKSAVESAPGSLIAPYVDGQGMKAAIEGFSTAAGATVLVCDDARSRPFALYRSATTASLEQLVAQLADPTNAIHNNGLTDLVLVSLDVEEGQADRIGRVAQALEGRNYVAVFTSLSTSEHSLSTPLRVAYTRRSYTAAPTTTTVQTGTRTPAGILEAGIVMTCIFAILLGALCCLKDLQTPARFDLGKNIVVAE